jgi:hypothetical protein
VGRRIEEIAMSLHDAQPAAPDPGPPRFYPFIHPEFGYLAPVPGFRRKAALVAKGLAFGLVAGVIAAVALMPDRDARLQTTFSIGTQAAAGGMAAPAPLQFLAATMALPATTAPPSTAGLAVSAPAKPAGAAPSAAAPSAVVEAPAEQRPAPKPRKKVARKPRRERDARPIDLEPRNAYAGPFRREPYDAGYGRRSFGFGW